MKKFKALLIVIGVFTYIGCSNMYNDIAGDLGDRSGLMAYWPIIETYTSATSYGKSLKDCSGNNNDIHIWANGPTGTPAATCVTGKFGNGLSFDGSDDYAYSTPVDLLKGSSKLTVSFWIKTGSVGIIPIINTPSFDISQDGSYLAFTLTGSGNPSAWYNSFPLGVWNHVAGVYDKATVKLYVNSVLVNEISSTIDLNVINSVYLCQDGSNVQFMSAILDDVRIYNKALTESEIAGVMNWGID